MPTKHRSQLLPKGALVEFIPQGAYVKVCAVDPVSAEEVSIVGDASAGSTTLAKAAVKKLEYVIQKKRSGQNKQADALANTGRPLDPADSIVKRAKRPDTPSGWDL